MEAGLGLAMSLGLRVPVKQPQVTHFRKLQVRVTKESAHGSLLKSRNVCRAQP